MKKWYYLLGLGAFFLLGYAVYNYTKSEPLSYGQSIDLANGEGKSYMYFVKLEYKVKDTVKVQYDTIQGIPGPHPAYVVVNEIKYHQGAYNWSGKPTNKLDYAIVKTLDPKGVFYRRISIKQQ